MWTVSGSTAFFFPYSSSYERARIMHACTHPLWFCVRDCFLPFSFLNSLSLPLSLKSLESSSAPQPPSFTTKHNQRTELKGKREQIQVVLAAVASGLDGTHNSRSHTHKTRTARWWGLLTLCAALNPKPLIPAAVLSPVCLVKKRGQGRQLSGWEWISMGRSNEESCWYCAFFPFLNAGQSRLILRQGANANNHLRIHKRRDDLTLKSITDIFKITFR